MLPDRQLKQPLEAKIIEDSSNGKTVFSMEHYEGAIPHPKLMKEWNEIVPGSAKEIFEQFKNQSNHRIESEKKVIRANNFKSYAGPIFAFLISMTAIIGGILVAIYVQPYMGSILSFTGLAAVITPFLVSEIRKGGKKNVDE